jgi:hypothetical protein
VLGAAFCTGCGVEFLETDPSATLPAPVVAAFERSCASAGCHSGTSAAQGLRLDRSGIAAALNQQSTQSSLRLIELGAPERSYLALKLLAPNLPAGSTIMGAPMPPTNSATARNDRETILAWIAQKDAGDTSTGETATAVDCLPTPQLSPGDSVQVQRDIAPIFELHCAGIGCHGGGGTQSPMLDGAALPASIVGVNVVSGADGVYVAPSSLDGSYLWRKLTGTHLAVRGGSGVAMPVADPLCADELATIEMWIAGGALSSAVRN